MIEPYWQSPDRVATLYQGDCVQVMRAMPRDSVDVIFADPPYFLSSEGGTTCQNGKRVEVKKGEWDRKRGLAYMHHFTGQWLIAARRVLKPEGTIWITGTQHSIHSAAVAMDQLGYRLINEIIWCLGGGTNVYADTAKGVGLVKIKDLAGLDHKSVRLWNGEKWTQLLGVSRTARAGNELTITLRSGEKISCTPKCNFRTWLLHW